MTARFALREPVGFGLSGRLHRGSRVWNGWAAACSLHHQALTMLERVVDNADPVVAVHTAEDRTKCQLCFPRTDA